MKSPRCDHAGYTQHGQENIDSGDNTKNARPTGEFDEVSMWLMTLQEKVKELHV